MQDEFDFLMPFPPHRVWLRPDEVARCLGCRLTHIYDLIAEGKLEAHADKDRDRKSYRITRRSVVLRLAETSLTEDPDYRMERINALLKSCSQTELTQIIKTATQLLTKP